MAANPRFYVVFRVKIPFVPIGFHTGKMNLLATNWQQITEPGFFQFLFEGLPGSCGHKPCWLRL